MKKHIKSAFLLAMMTVMYSFQLSAQSMDQFSIALKSGNASELAKYFQSNVELNTTGSSNSFSKTQAEQVLTNFFRSKSVKSFSIVHQGTSPEGSKYMIGNMATTGGNYRVYLYAKQSGSALGIQEIRFEEQ